MRVIKKANVIRVILFLILVLCVHVSFVNFKRAANNAISEASKQITETVSEFYSNALENTDCPEEIFNEIQSIVDSATEGQIRENIVYLKRHVYQSAYILLCVIVVVFVIIFIMMLQLQRESLQVAKDMEKFTIANEQISSCVFDYDLQNRKITFSENYESLFGKIKNPIDVKEFRKVYVNIHEEDRSAMINLKERFEGSEINDEKFSTEIRFKCPGEDYKWYRISGATTFEKSGAGKNGKPTHFIGNFTDVNAQVNHEKELRHIAETDMLSGLLNKSFFQKKVTEFLENATESARGAFFIIDLDNFKTTNDTLGHVMGDIAIRDTAQKISLIFTHKDILGRIGGDEFCVYLRMDNVSEDVAAKIIMEKAASLNETLQEYYNNEKDSVQISASVGIALYPQHGTDFQTLFRCADAALYYVKKNGKNGNVIYTSKMKNGDERFYE